MLPLNTRGKVEGVQERSAFKVLTFDEACQSDIDPARCLIWRDQTGNTSTYPNSHSWAGMISPGSGSLGPHKGGVTISGLSNPYVVAPGDVIRVDKQSSRISVLYRRGSTSNTLLATNRCNSFCVMCSQPPTAHEDRWLVSEMLETIPLIDRDEAQLGISGGEPTLLGDDLAGVILQAKNCLPDTELHILSNGRRFSDAGLARVISAVRHPAVIWGIPIYSDCPEVHDYIVQSKGAWAETLQGLYNLAPHTMSIELRIVVQRANVERLGELSRFIFCNLSFVDHIAFMGLEPMGFAKFNRDQIWVDPSDCDAALSDAVFYLANRGLDVSIYNFPLCTLSQDLWPFCLPSISDWKNKYLPICSDCSVQDDCSGFFGSVNSEWIGRRVTAIPDGEIAATHRIPTEERQ